MPLTLLRHATQKPPLGPQKLDIEHPLAFGLQRAYILNEQGSPTVSDYAQSKTGTLVAPAAWGSRGGPTFTNAGGGAVDCGTSLVINGSHTLAVRAYLTAVTIPASILGGISKGQWGNDGNGDARVLVHVGGWEYAVNNGTDTAITDPAAATTGAWLWHIGTWDGITMRLYRDGAQVISTAKSGALTNNAKSLYLGSYPSNSGAGATTIDGTIESGFVWNRALSAAEVGAFVSEPYAMFQTRPLQRWFTVVSAAVAIPNKSYQVRQAVNRAATY